MDKNYYVFTNHFDNKFPEASYLGEHGVALGAEKRGFSQKLLYLAEPYRVSTEIQSFFWGLSSRYAPQDKMPRQRNYQQLITGVVRIVHKSPGTKKIRLKGETPKKPFDREAQWGYSETKDWIYGYGIHLTCLATPKNPVLPILAELTPANNKGIKILEKNLERIPAKTRYLVADKEYDVQRLYQKSKRRLLTPVRETKNRETKKKTISKERKIRQRFFKSKEGQRIYRLRNSSVEPLFNVIKTPLLMIMNE